MKALPKRMAAAVVAGILFFPLCGATATEWVLYDDFSRDQINENKWEVVMPNPDLSSVKIKDGKLRMKLRALKPDSEESVSDFARVYLAKNPETIKSIRANVTVVRCTGDARARVRIDRFQDTKDADYYQSVNLFGAEKKIEMWVEKWHVEESDKVYWWTSLPFHFPTPIIEQKHKVGLFLHPDQFEAKVGNVGKLVYAPVGAQKVDMTPDFRQRIALDVRSSDGKGEIVVLFDRILVEYY